MSIVLTTKGRRNRTALMFDPSSERWDMVIDDEKGGWSTRFATLVLQRNALR